MQLYTRIRDAQGDPAISGPWHSANVKRWTLLEDSSDRYRLTLIRSKVGNHPVKRIPSLPSPSRVENMLRPLGLPTLPPHDTFCYYATKQKLVDKLTKIHSGAEVMPPLMRAKALEWVQLS